MLKRELEKHIERLNYELGSIQSDISWIKKSISNIDNHLKKLNGNVENINLKIINHENRLTHIENNAKKEEKIKWFYKKEIWGMLGSALTGILFVLIDYLLHLL